MTAEFRTTRNSDLNDCFVLLATVDAPSSEGPCTLAEGIGDFPQIEDAKFEIAGSCGVYQELFGLPGESHLPRILEDADLKLSGALRELLAELNLELGQLAERIDEMDLVIRKVAVSMKAASECRPSQESGL